MLHEDVIKITPESYRKGRTLWERAQPPKPRRTAKPATIGAISEYAVVNDLLRRGADVYRSASPNAAYDLVAALGGALIRIEVKTAALDGQGRCVARITQAQLDSCDVLAIVRPNGTVLYQPDTAIPEMLD